MRNVLPALLVDGYKVGHVFQYPSDTEFVYSNLTPRKSRTGEHDALQLAVDRQPPRLCERALQRNTVPAARHFSRARATCSALACATFSARRA